MVHPDNVVRDIVKVPNIDDDGEKSEDVMKVNCSIIDCVDVRNEFTTDETFLTRQYMLDWIRTEATKLGFGVVIGRSDNGTSTRQTFVTVVCERGGKYIAKIWKYIHEDTGTRKCGCLFKVRGYCRVDDIWRFNVISGLHNHALDKKLHGHPIVSRLKPEEKVIIKELSLIKVAPRNILTDLKRKRPNSFSNIKQVYNARCQQNALIRGSGSEMQQLLKCLDDNNYVSRYRVCADKVSIRNIFWTHPESIKLFNTFPTVLIIDSTYKTNKYRLPLLEIVGVTSTDKTYSVGFAFFESEKEDNVTWALDICKTLLKDPNNMPNVIITDRDNALMNAIASVFPTSSVLLCRYHITKNVRSRLKPAVGTKEITDDDGKVVKPLVVVERIMNGWMNILNSSSEELYVENVVNFRKLCVKYPDFLKYVESTILDQVKEKVVCAWTDRLRHLGCTTTNRVESAHASLKRWLGDSKGDLCREWDTVNQMLANQHNEIQSTFENQMRT